MVRPQAKFAAGAKPAAHWRLHLTHCLRQAVTLMDTRLAGKIELVTLPSVGATVGIIILHVEGKVVEGLVSREVVPAGVPKNQYAAKVPVVAGRVGNDLIVVRTEENDPSKIVVRGVSDDNVVVAAEHRYRVVDIISDDDVVVNLRQDKARSSVTRPPNHVSLERPVPSRWVNLKTRGAA